MNWCWAFSHLSLVLLSTFNRQKLIFASRSQSEVLSDNLWGLMEEMCLRQTCKQCLTMFGLESTILSLLKDLSHFKNMQGIIKNRHLKDLSMYDPSRQCKFCRWVSHVLYKSPPHYLYKEKAQSPPSYNIVVSIPNIVKPRLYMSGLRLGQRGREPQSTPPRRHGPAPALKAP